MGVMKTKPHAARKTSGKTAVTTAPKRPGARRPYLVGIVLAVALAFEVYGPSLYGPFLFDDEYLSFNVRNFPVDSLRAWMAGVRPLLMFSYWVNYQISGFQTLSYHVFNVIFHAANSILVFFIAGKILEFARVEGPRRNILAAFAGALFLLHPVNSESVGYVASRSENLSVLFFFAAFALFLYRRKTEIAWARAALVLVLFGAAALTKEHTIVLPALLLLTDYFWNPPFSFGGIRRNWRLYVPIAIVGILVGAYLVRLLRGAPSAGFAVRDLNWYQYFFTECRAFWVYIRLFLFPAGLRIDYDFPISRTLLDHGAAVGLVAILTAAGAAFYFRRRYPLAAFGFFAFVILMAPTSSFVPIKDPLAERRLYLSMIGLLFIVLEFLRRVDIRRAKWMVALGAVLIVAAIATHQRNAVWSDPVLLWEDTAAKSPHMFRDQFHLAEAYRERGDCAKALPYYARSEQLNPSDDAVLIDWGLAYDCLHQPDPALAKFRQAAALRPTAHAYSQIGMVYGKQGRNAEAIEALQTAIKLDPGFEVTYVYLGGVHGNMGDLRAAIADFQKALAIDPDNETAAQALATAQAALASRR